MSVTVMWEAIGAVFIILGLFVCAYAICARVVAIASVYSDNVQIWMAHCTVGQRGYIISEVCDISRKDYVWTRFWGYVGSRIWPPPEFGPLIQHFEMVGWYPCQEKDKDWWEVYIDIYCRLDRKQRRKVSLSMSFYGPTLGGLVYGLRKHGYDDKIDAWQRRGNPPVTVQMAEEYEEIMKAQELMHV